MTTKAAILLSCLTLPVAQCDEPVECQHQPIIVRSRPVIERLPLKVIDPADICITEFGATIVAERQAGIVFLLAEDGQSSILAEDCKGLERIADSALTGIHALCCRTTSSTIYRVTDTGFVSNFAELNFRATGLAAGGAGQIWTANPRSGDVILIDVQGKAKIIKTVADHIVDITADDQGAYLLTDSGRILSVGADGSSLLVGHVSNTATRIQLRPDHQLIALAKSADRHGLLLEPQSVKGTGRQIGKVPLGTQAFAYDSLGNLTLGNPDLRALTRVTSHFQVPCPHCGQHVPMTLSADAPASPAKRRSF